MNYNGKQIIESLAKRLDFLNKRCYDSNILRLFESLSAKEINQLLTFGDIDTWIVERNKKTDLTTH